MSVVALALLGLLACSADEATVGRAHTMVEEGATLLDVRTPGEFAAGHLDGATNIPLGSLTSRMDEIPTGQAVVVYCQSGIRSARAATELEGRGYEVLDLGAMSSWDR